MGHRHLFNTTQILEADNDQEWNHSEQAYVHIARTGASEGNTSDYPAENLAIDGGNFASQWNPAPRSGGYSSTGLAVELQPYQPQAPGLSHEPFLHPPAAGGFQILQESYPHHASSSNHVGQTFHGVDGGTSSFTAVSGRRPFKRKSPGLPPVCERGSSSRYYENGSSSSLSMPVDPWHEKQVSESLQTRWDVPPSYRGHSFTIHNEDTSRNVRHRAAYDLEANASRTHLPINPHNSIPSLPADHPRSANLWSQTPNELTREWNHSLNASHGRPFMSGNSSQSIRGVRSSYMQRSLPNFGASSSNLPSGHAAPPDVGLQGVAESYASRHPRPFSSVVLRDRSGWSRISSDRYRYFPDEMLLRGQLAPEGLVIAGRSGLYESRSPYDQHRDMRLDIDNMSYEELLALEERIGHVNTGLSDDLISKCMTKLIFCSPDQSQEERKCAICLEEYQNADGVGTLKACRHDFHVECVHKWLTMKNLCPICKTTALDDNMKQKI